MPGCMRIAAMPAWCIVAMPAPGNNAPPNGRRFGGWRSGLPDVPGTAVGGPLRFFRNSDFSVTSHSWWEDRSASRPWRRGRTTPPASPVSLSCRRRLGHRKNAVRTRRGGLSFLDSCRSRSRSRRARVAEPVSLDALGRAIRRPRSILRPGQCRSGKKAARGSIPGPPPPPREGLGESGFRNPPCLSLPPPGMPLDSDPPRPRTPRA